MVHISILTSLLALSASLVSAAPAASKSKSKTTSSAAAVSSSSSSSTSVTGATAACTFKTSAAVIKGKASCTTIVLDSVVVAAGQTLDLTKLKTGTKVIFQGTTTFGYEEWSGPLISVSGTNIAVSGASGNKINGDGARWWDGEGTNGGKTKPKFFYAHSMISSTITGLNFVDSPVQLMSINGAKTLTVSDITLDNTAGDVTNGGHNTDAFDVGSSDSITISGANIKNQDDCLAINSGTNIIFTGGTCDGGHGLSIGSVGGRSDNVVKTVTISSSTISNSDNGPRIKTVSGATGSVSGITYKDIKLVNIAKYGIVIQQDYENGSPTGKPTTGVPITDLTVTNVTGSVTGLQVYILCGKGSCSNWKWSGVAITGGKKSTTCSNIPSGSGAAC